MPHLQVLGPTQLVTGDPAAAAELLAQPRPTSLLIYLAAAHPGAFHRRDFLVTLFWPESGQEQARTNLRKLLHVIRKALGEHALEGRGDEEVRLAPGLLTCDLVEFEDAYGRRQMARAVEMLGKTQPSDWIAVSGASVLEDWASATRMRIADTAAAAAWHLALMHDAEDAFTEAGRWARRVVEFAPEDEHRLRRVLTLMVDRIGDHGTAMRLYERFRERLRKEYQAAPAPETIALIQRLRLTPLRVNAPASPPRPPNPRR